MDTSKVKIRILGYPELEIALDWAAREGWNPGVNDGKCFHAADPQGFLAGFMDERPVATISAVKYGTSFAFVGFYIVEPEFRGQGLGRRIWYTALEAVEGRVAGLDGVVAQQGFYARSGFVLAHRNVRWRGVAEQAVNAPGWVRPASQVGYSALFAYDRELFGFDRDSFLRAWIGQESAIARVAVLDGEVKGLGIVRRCREGHKIGPLFADTPSLAEALFLSLTGQLPPGALFFLDIPEPNPEALALVNRHGMEPVFDTARMYRGKAPQLPLQRIFGITSFELG